MNLTDLQVELRSIENHIEMLHSEIEKMKPKAEEEKRADFDIITKLADKYPIKNRTIASAPEDLKKLFAGSLSYMLLTAERDIYSRLLYICRLAKGSGMAFSAEDIYIAGLEFEMKDIERICKDLSEYKDTYLVEAFIVANIAEEAPIEMIKLISDIAAIMGCDEEEIRMYAYIAKSRLADNIDILDEIPIPSKNRWSNRFSDYIPGSWIKERRMACGEGVLNYENITIEKKLPSGSIVKKGEAVLTYTERPSGEQLMNDVQKASSDFSKRNMPSELNMMSSVLKDAMPWLGQVEQALKESLDSVRGEETKKTVYAPKDGIVYFWVDEKHVVAYIVSYFDDYTDFCDWIKEQPML